VTISESQRECSGFQDAWLAQLLKLLQTMKNEEEGINKGVKSSDCYIVEREPAYIYLRGPFILKQVTVDVSMGSTLRSKPLRRWALPIH
jgi:hypothetical protein